MATAILAPSELEVMASLLQRLAGSFNEDEGGLDAVAAELVDLGSWLHLHQGEPAAELVAYWLERQNDRVPLG